MVQSLNTKMDMTSKGTWFREGPIYGNIMVGDQAFEFYNDTKLRDYIQIPSTMGTYAFQVVKAVRPSKLFKNGFLVKV